MVFLTPEIEYGERIHNIPTKCNISGHLLCMKRASDVT